MWPLLKALLIKLGMLRGFFALLGSIAAIVPLALALLKVVGWPLLVVLFVVGLPVMIVLAIVGFPFIAVLAIGGMALAVALTLLALGVVAVKFAVFVVLPLWLLWKLVKWVNAPR